MIRKLTLKTADLEALLWPGRDVRIMGASYAISTDEVKLLLTGDPRDIPMTEEVIMHDAPHATRFEESPLSWNKRYSAQ